MTILQLADGCLLADTLTETSGDIVWGNDSRHFYDVKVMPGTLQRAQVYRHHLGTAQQQDATIGGILCRQLSI
jgi:oligopeptidase B